MSLRLESIEHQFGRTPVLNGLTIDVVESEWLAIVGSNGSGRSTLAKISTGLLRPHRGRVLVADQDIWLRRGKPLRGQLGLVMQRAEDQFLGQTVYEDIAFGPRQTHQDEKDVRRAVSTALESVDFDLAHVRGRSPLEFSGGQRRRLAVAGILALEPTALVLDEPFAGLDCEARNEMVDLLERLRSKRGMTVVTLTTDLEHVLNASRLALLTGGEIALVGDIRDFIANQRLCSEAGIVMPETIRLALDLRERGWNVPILAQEGALENAVAHEWRLRHMGDSIHA